MADLTPHRKISEKKLDEMANSGELTGIAMRMAIDEGADWPSLDGDARDAWHEAAIRRLRGEDPHAPEFRRKGRASNG